MTEEVDVSGKGMPGEASFLIAELALTIARVDWASTARILPLEVVLDEARGVLAEVKALGRKRMPEDPLLARYVRRALTEARL
jgi:hypothetical protein